MTLIKNGTIVTEKGEIAGHALAIDDERIAAIVPDGGERDVARRATSGGSTAREVIDAEGGYVIPGFVDIHSDYIEHMTSPRPTSVMDFSLGLRETERELVSHGITTMFHSLSIYKRALFSEKPIRNPENVRKFADVIARSHSSLHLIRHRFHARFEIDNIDRTEELLEYIREGKVHLVSFMDHTPGQGQYRDIEMYRSTLKGYQDLSESELDRIVAETQGSRKLTLDRISEIAGIARERGIAVASHDDDSVEKLAFARSFGTTISEFPITLEVAREAKALGFHTIAGAPNVLLGGSHSGNLSAEEAIADGCVDILCSDYYPAAMIHAVFSLHDRRGIPLHELVNLVTINPARAVLMDGEIGSIEVGKKADVLVVKRIENGFPVVAHAIVDGKEVFSSRYRTEGRTV